jgi:hypothetical protein
MEYALHDVNDIIMPGCVAIIHFADYARNWEHP